MRPPTESNYFDKILISAKKLLFFTKKTISVGGLVLDIRGSQAEINFGGDILFRSAATRP